VIAWGAIGFECAYRRAVRPPYPRDGEGDAFSQSILDLL
jgi:hypothetical protein